MRWLLFFLMASTGTAAHASFHCGTFQVHLSPLAGARFHAAAEQSLKKFPSRSYDWFIAKHEPLIAITPGSLKTIVQTVGCCGLSAEVVRETITGLQKGADHGAIPVRLLYSELLTKALATVGVAEPNLPFDCTATALTFLDAKLYAAVDEADVDNWRKVVFGGKLRELPKSEPTQWGDFVEMSRDGEPAHLMIVLGNGLVLHKTGTGKARIEPQQQAEDFYREFFRRQYPGKKNEITYTRWRRAGAN